MVDWTPYLNSLCKAYTQWWTFGTLKDVVEPKRFEFDLMVQTVERDAQHKSKEEQKVERLSVLEGLRKYASEHVLLVGRPGSGKSTALVRLLVATAQQALQNQHSQIPVLVELRTYNIYYKTSVLDLVQASLKRRKLRLNLETIEDLLAEGRLLLLMDGINELPDDEARNHIKAFRLDYSDVPMVFTTRDLGVGGDLGIERKLEMQSLTEAEVEKFVRECMPGGSQQTLQQLRQRLRELGQTPFVMGMLYFIVEKTGTVPSGAGSAFREFTQLYERRSKDDAPVSEESRRWWSRLLEHLGFEMMQADKPTDFRLTISKREAEDIITKVLDREKFDKPRDYALRWLEDLLKHHLIQVTSNDQIEFCHQLIQEYYAAEILLKVLTSPGRTSPPAPLLRGEGSKIPVPPFPGREGGLGGLGLSDDELKRGYLNYLKWTEPLALMLELVEDEGQAVQVVQLALEVDLQLGARLAGAVKPKWQEQTVGLVAGLEIPQLLKIQLLGITKSGQTIHQLERALEDTNALIRWLAVLSLKEIGNVAAVTALAKALEDENSFIRGRTILVLEAIGDAAAVNVLVQVLTYEDSDIRQKAAYVLGRIRNPAAINGLVQALEYEEAGVSVSAADALGKIDDSAAINALVKALKCRIARVRQSAAYALGEIRNVAAVESLVSALKKDEEADIRRSAAQALGKIGDSAAVNPLVQALKDHAVCGSAAYALYKIGVGDSDTVDGLVKALKDKCSSVRNSAIRALEKIGNPVAIDSLVQALIDEDFNVRVSATCALSRISNSAGDNGLVQALKSKNSAIRDEAASALGEFGSSVTVNPLVEALEDEESSVRGSAAWALGKIGDSDAVDSLVQALKDAEPSVRRSAAIALGEIGNPTVVNNLVQALKDEEASVRRSAASALGKFDNPVAVNALVQALEDEEHFVRWRAVSSLNKIGNSVAVNGLVKALKDERASVREHVVFALKEIVNPTAIDGLIQALKDKEADVRQSAVYALEIDDLTAINALINTLEDKDAGVRASAAYVLGEIGNSTAVGSLVQALKDEEASVRSSAAYALGEVGNSTAVGSLVQALKDEEASVRSSAAYALGEIGNSTAVGSLVQALGDQEPSVGENAAYALGAIGNSTAINALIDVLAHEDSVVYESAVFALGAVGNVAAVDGLLKAFKGEDSNIRDSAASLLGEISNHAAVNGLVQALKDNRRDVREKAASVLNKVSNSTAINALIQALKDEDFVAANQGGTFGQAIEILQTIQNRCKFYNYTLATSPPLQEENNPESLTADLQQYEEILSVLSNMVTVMERNPKTFGGIEEEALRDHFLVQLNGKYKGQATGETFNKKGKTDILIRVEGKNIFIAECKFWGGEKKLIETLGQLLGYTTWRDTKLALLIFNRNKNFSAVLEQISEVLKNHPTFTHELSYPSETGFRFILHHPEDKNRELLLTVLAFEIPRSH